MLEVNNVTVRYGEKTVVNQVSFSLKPGQWLMLCGPNGAGKSTLVKAISQSTAYTGQVYLSGQDVRKLRPRQLAQKVGVLSQTHRTEYAFTVEEVVSLGRYAHSRGFLSDRNGAQAVEHALQATGLTELRGQSLLTLSGGELQRVFLAQVIAQSPTLLILDEPANHLDLLYQKQLFTLIADWLKQPERAVISVVHDLNLARKYGTHALLMSQGQSVAQGEIRQVLTRDKLQEVYGLDVYDWNRELLSQWTTEDENSPAAHGTKGKPA